MDKYELVLDIIEHPDRYTAQKLEEIFSDADMREIYDILCKTDTTIKAYKEVDVDKEWLHFERKTAFRKRPLFLRGNRVASIAAIVFTSIAAVAAGIAVSVAISENKKVSEQNERVVAEVTKPILATSEKITEIDSVNDQKEIVVSPILFEDETLSVILAHIAEVYGVEVKFGDNDVANLHLYYKFDSSLTLEEVVAQLNNFESINITLTGNTLIID